MLTRYIFIVNSICEIIATNFSQVMRLTRLYSFHLNRITVLNLVKRNKINGNCQWERNEKQSTLADLAPRFFTAAPSSFGGAMNGSWAGQRSKYRAHKSLLKFFCKAS